MCESILVLHILYFNRIWNERGQTKTPASMQFPSFCIGNQKQTDLKRLFTVKWIQPKRCSFTTNKLSIICDILMLSQAYLIRVLFWSKYIFGIHLKLSTQENGFRKNCLWNFPISVRTLETILKLPIKQQPIDHTLGNQNWRLKANSRLWSKILATHCVCCHSTWISISVHYYSNRRYTRVHVGEFAK